MPNTFCGKLKEETSHNSRVDSTVTPAEVAFFVLFTVLSLPLGSISLKNTSLTENLFGTHTK